ncbi:SLC13 family permease [Algibacillus agarilyticus]|uniref:SLC13 family permease n=1 Tax=Algibacillus agarilyticus TaxID=2234133 RepID=UPI000DCF8386|nr:SLC13 family permease [Algibacillus agarilyticus]
MRSPLFLGPLFAMGLYFICTYFEISHEISITLAITLLVAAWWVTEALPIPVTSLVPFVLFPLAGIIDHKTAASALGSHVILLLMGAFMLSKAVEKSGVNDRLALSLVNFLGKDKPQRVVLGFMISAALMSMWISNTATTLMLLPMALAVIASVNNKRFATVLLLGIAYAANIGGMGTPIGTPPNVILLAIYEQEFGRSISFLEWMSMGLPVVCIGVPLCAYWLTRGMTLNLSFELPKVQAWRSAEKRVLLVFGLTALAWIFKQAPFGGWTGLLGDIKVGDSTIALAGVCLMFLIPEGDNKKGRLLDWQTANQIPWGMLLLFAGGICIAKAFQASGLSELMGEGLSQLAFFPPLLMIGLITLSVVFLTEITSNTATTTLLMPILAIAGISAGLDPILLMLPAALSASCAFMLPVATAPNAIVYSTNRFKIADMAREGLVINLLMIVVITLMCFWLI